MLSHKKRDTLADKAEIRFSTSKKLVDSSQDQKVAIASVELIANETNRQAVLLRDKGQIKEAQKVLNNNAAFLKKKAKKLKSKKLDKLSAENLDDEKNLKGSKWKAQRKTMRKRQHSLDVQQLW